jgi:probable rRNA maturation factor
VVGQLSLKTARLKQPATSLRTYQINHQTMQILVINRQRLIKVDLADIQEMAGKLWQSTCQNLLNEPSKEIPLKLARQINKDASLSLVLLSNKGIRKLNRIWRQKDYETDVVSFPLNLKEPKANVPWELGDIFISIEKAAEQAKAFNHGLPRELAFLCVHGMLHLLGFDHETARDEKMMRRRQKEILEAASYPRR